MIPIEEEELIRMTRFSHGAGCGCKIAPGILDTILEVSGKSILAFPDLLIGNAERDDAAVMDLGDGTAIISTTDFFMPIVDDPELFGQIAATNAISDVYAMGGKPIMAIAILGWPVNVINPAIAGRVIRGAQKTCHEAGIPLAGGHSIDSPEPIFGLSVTGRIDINHIKKNGGAQPGDFLFLTKPLGIGILTTAEKKGKLRPEHTNLAAGWMTKLNTVGERLGRIKEVRAMTDVTGFGLAGHLLEMCRASNTTAELRFDTLPLIDNVIETYVKEGCVPGGTERNYASFSEDVFFRLIDYKAIVCDPQTSGGLLVAVSPEGFQEIQEILKSEKLWAEPIGRMKMRSEYLLEVN